MKNLDKKLTVTREPVVRELTLLERIEALESGQESQDTRFSECTTNLQNKIQKLESETSSDITGIRKVLRMIFPKF